MTRANPPAKRSRTNQLRGLLGRLRRAISNSQNKPRWVMMIINPASGQGSPDLRLYNRILLGAGYNWQVEVTNNFGDAARLARGAVRGGASAVAVYGGDGTVMDAAAGLVGTNVPLAILPGGTGNALARELLIPFDLAAACHLIVDGRAATRSIDLGRVDGRLFALRMGVGLEADITRTADRELKDRMGLLAYAAATLQAWNQAAVSRYRLELDGGKVEVDGLACMIANAGNLGIPGVNISPKVRIDDGLLDVMVIRRADLAELASLAASVIGTQSPAISSLPHWQVRQVRIEADPPQGVEADGEELGQTPVKAEALPGALKVIVPG